MYMTYASACPRMILTLSFIAINVVDRAYKCFSPNQIILLDADQRVTLIKKTKEIPLRCQNIATSDYLCFKTNTSAKVKV